MNVGDIVKIKSPDSEFEQTIVARHPDSHYRIVRVESDHYVCAEVGYEESCGNLWLGKSSVEPCSTSSDSQ